MTIDNLRCFLVLAQELNFTRAAESAHITQTTMSRKIKDIEDEIGVQLFLRDHHNVRLTEAGVEFRSRVEDLVSQYDKTISKTRNSAMKKSQTIFIGVGLFEHHLLFPVLERFFDENSISSVRCVQYPYRELIKRFQKGELDIIVTDDHFIYEFADDVYEKVLLYNEASSLAISRKNPLADKPEITLEDLESENLITMNVDNNEEFWLAFSGNFSFKMVDYVNSINTKLMLIAANRGIGFFPPFINTLGYPEIVLRKDVPEIHRRKFYAIYKDDLEIPLIRGLAELLADYYRCGDELQDAD